MCGVAYCCEWYNVGTTNGRRVREAREHWRRARRSDSGYVSDRFSESSSRRNGFARFLDFGKKLIKVGFPEANELKFVTTSRQLHHGWGVFLQLNLK